MAGQIIFTIMTCFGNIYTLWRHRLEARTSASQAGNRGSIPLGAAKKNIDKEIFMKVKIIKEKCSGCGTCTALCPDVFELTEEVASVIEKANLEENKDCIKEASEACPGEAIVIAE